MSTMLPTTEFVAMTAEEDNILVVHLKGAVIVAPAVPLQQLLFTARPLFNFGSSEKRANCFVERPGGA